MPEWDPSVVWHILTESSVPVAELSRALSRLTSVISWRPEMSFTGALQNWTTTHVPDQRSSLRQISFPLQRGYTRLPGQVRQKVFRKVFEMLQARTPDTSNSVLVCTSSFWVDTAALWQGPVVYYATDRTYAYAGLSPSRVLAADRIMCGIADIVCPNSRRLADYFEVQCDCAKDKIVMLPNATRADNVRSHSFDKRGDLPTDIAGLPRPIVGVIGNMGDNVDWELVHFAMENEPAFTWLFVGPFPTAMLSRDSFRARAKVIQSARAVVIGARPYGELYQYARAIDIAVLPYNRIEPTFSGSSTRFYEHLAAGRPILATRGVEELLHKEHLLTLVNNAEDLVRQLHGFAAEPSDRREATRCFASRSETWEARAASMRTAVHPLLGDLTWRAT